MNEILATYEPITLDEMSGVKLLNRTDTKFVTTVDKLKELLKMAQPEYRVQEINGERIARYYTVYFDTPDHAMYMAHQAGHTNRQKLRIRSYVDSHLNFLEIKTKNNHGRTKKNRISLAGFDPVNPDHNMRFSASDDNVMGQYEFVKQNLKYSPDILTQQLENHFNRVTLVNKGKTERLTIDTGLVLDNLQTGVHLEMPKIAIIELKRDGLVHSPILELVKQLRIKAMGFSKYTVGTALTNKSLKQNRLKPRIHKIARMNPFQLYKDVDNLLELNKVI